MDKDFAKRAVAKYVFKYLQEDGLSLGVGTGSTVNYFIEELKSSQLIFKEVVSSSIQTTKLLNSHNISTTELNSADIDIYIDGADEVNALRQMIKGGGGALTGEKLLAINSKKVIIIIDESKYVEQLGRAYPLPIEVIPMARSYLAREIRKLGQNISINWRRNANGEAIVTDYGNWILDVQNLDIRQAIELEQQLNQIEGVVSNGLFAKRPADIVIIANSDGSIRELK